MCTAKVRFHLGASDPPPTENVNLVFDWALFCASIRASIWLAQPTLLNGQRRVREESEEEETSQNSCQNQKETGLHKIFPQKVCCYCVSVLFDVMINCDYLCVVC